MSSKHYNGLIFYNNIILIYFSHLRHIVLAGRLRFGVRWRWLRILRQGILCGRRHAAEPKRRVVLPIRVRGDRGDHHIGGGGREVQFRRLHILQRRRIGCVHLYIIHE